MSSRLSNLETQFHAQHQRWKQAPDGPLQRAAFRKMNQITNRILEERAHGTAGMRIKLRTWLEWYGDSEFPEDAKALIASLAADLDLRELSSAKLAEANERRPC